MPKLILTEAQKNFFLTFGYLVLPGLLKDRIEELKKDFDRVLEMHTNHTGAKRTIILPFLDASETFSAFLDEGHEIHDIAASLLGDDFNYVSSDGNYYTGDTAWHSDPGDENARLTDDGLIFMKIAVYFDEVKRESGALRVIPGSHLRGDKFSSRLEKELQSGFNQEKMQIYNKAQLWGLAGDQIPSVALESSPGDVVIFNHLIQHASFGGNTRRAMLAISVCKRYAPEKSAEFQTMLKLYLDLIKNSTVKIDSAYGDIMLNTASPDRKVHLEQVLENYQMAKQIQS
jgi:hypothetical protein